MDKRLTKIMGKMVEIMKRTEPSKQEETVKKYLKEQDLSLEELNTLMTAIIKSL
jgi:hypothetical protein